MTYRIITHAGCTDGFSSAFIFKKYVTYFTDLTEDDIKDAEIIPLLPRDVQTPDEFEFTDKDILLDLPKPDTNVFFWADHHSSNKQDKMTSSDYWKVTPSCTGFLLDLAEKNGLKITKELQDFKVAMDKIDSAAYTPEEIKACYYRQNEYTTPLQKMHQLSSLFHTRDKALNHEIFTTVLFSKLGETPLSTESIWNFSPEVFHKAQIINYEAWREFVDEFIEEVGNTVVQDNRDVGFSKGVPDRFYAYIKFPKASYNFVLKQVDEKMLRVGLGSNIFNKKLCKVDIGKLCKEVGTKFGEGSGGGHFYVGGATIFVENGDEAKKFILDKLK
jgi:hypothetical protein